MTEEMQKKYRMQFWAIIGMAVIILVISFYLGAMIQCVMADIMNPKYDPASVFTSIKEKGIPWILIASFAVFGESALFVAVRKLLRDQEGADTLGRIFHYSVRHQVYGDSHFETPDEYADAAWVQTPDDAYGPILGQVGSDGSKLINLRCDYQMRLNQHIMIVGASGSGKTYTFTKPYAYQAIKRRESVVFTDPDGGLTRTLSNVFRENGYIVRVFNLNNLTKSDGWDCMRVIMDSDNKELAAQIFADTIISNIPGAGDKVQPIYRDGPLSLLKALLLRVATDEGGHFKERTLKEAYDILQNEDESFLDKIFCPDIMSENEKVALGPYQSFKTASPNLRGNLITNLSTSLNLLQTKAVADVLSVDEIDLTLPGRQPCAYFCQFPDSHDTYKFVVSLFFSMLFMMLTNYADAQVDNDGRLPVPVNFMLDEFPSIGVIPDFDRKMATIRKRGMNVAMIVQDITQLQNNYPTTWTTLQSNCSTFLALGINDQYTADMITKRVGETTVKVETRQHHNFEGLFQLDNRYSTGEGKRALLQFDELFKLDKDDCLILLQYHNPIFAHKYPHVLHPMSTDIAPYNISKRPDITERAARDEEHAEELFKVSAYLEEHPLSEVDRSYKWMFNEDTEKKSKKKHKKDRKNKANKNSVIQEPENEIVSEEPEKGVVPDEAYPICDPETGEVIDDLSGIAAASETPQTVVTVDMREEVKPIPQAEKTPPKAGFEPAGNVAETSRAWDEAKAKYAPAAPPARHAAADAAGDHPIDAREDSPQSASSGTAGKGDSAEKTHENQAQEDKKSNPAQPLGVFARLHEAQKEKTGPVIEKVAEAPKSVSAVRAFSDNHGGPETSKRRKEKRNVDHGDSNPYASDENSADCSIHVNSTVIDPTGISDKRKPVVPTKGMYGNSGKRSNGMVPPAKKKNE